MPLALKPKELKTEFDNNKSVLIIACSVCPKMCLAAQNKKPYFSLFGGSRGNAFQEYLQDMRNRLSQRGVASEFFRAPLDTPMCLWPLTNRRKIAALANYHDAIAVVGCDSALATVNSSLTTTEKNVVQMMDVAGIANFISRISFPFNIYLEATTEKEIPI